MDLLIYYFCITNDWYLRIDLKLLFLKRYIKIINNFEIVVVM